MFNWRKKRSAVEKVSIPNYLSSLTSEENHSLPEDRKCDVLLLGLGTHAGSQECYIDGYSDLGLEISKSSSCAYSNEGKKKRRRNDSYCLEPIINLTGCLACQILIRVIKSMNWSTSSEINHTENVNKQLCRRVSVSIIKKIDLK